MEYIKDYEFENLNKLLINIKIKNDSNIVFDYLDMIDEKIFEIAKENENLFGKLIISLQWI